MVTTESSAADNIDLSSCTSSRSNSASWVILPVLLGGRQECISEELAGIAAAGGDGTIEPYVDDRYAFDEGSETHRRAADGDFLGKVLLVNEESIGVGSLELVSNMIRRSLPTVYRSSHSSQNISHVLFRRQPGWDAQYPGSFALGSVSTTRSLARNTGRSLAPIPFLTLCGVARFP